MILRGSSLIIFLSLVSRKLERNWSGPCLRSKGVNDPLLVRGGGSERLGPVSVGLMLALAELAGWAITAGSGLGT
jgi:hypothetical protein